MKIDDDIAETPEVVERALAVNEELLVDARRLVHGAPLVRVLAVPAEPLVEHLHGPVAARSTVLAIVDGDDPNLVPFPVRIGIDDDATVTVPHTGDPSLDVLTKPVVAQRVVRGWSDDPDADRGLAKVTLTR